jgi:hypothetical protein
LLHEAERKKDELFLKEGNGPEKQEHRWEML